MQHISRREVKFARANGIDIAYQTFGDKDASPLILIMGLGSQMVLWDGEFCRQLAAGGYRVIRFDNRDIGLSTKLDWMQVPDTTAIAAALQRGEVPAVPYTLEDMAADTAELLTALGYDKAHIVGESMGGMIGQIMAINLPERLLSLTSIMSSTGNPFLPPPSPEVLEILYTPFPTDHDGFVESFVRTFKVLSGAAMPLSEALARKWAEQSYKRGLNPAGVARQFAAIMAAGDRTEKLKSISIPTLVIHGDVDPLLPVECGLATAAAIPGSRLKIIQEMGHALPEAVWSQIVAEIIRHAI
ncbi:MAG: alpha/beta hydrolase [Desulfobacterales bacterium]|jgi:pimeloyl-ACP methyl ester carboxylesterase